MILGIAACFGYIARVRAMVGAERCLPVKLRPLPSALSRTFGIPTTFLYLSLLSFLYLFILSSVVRLFRT
jgi:hypothetical protein